MFSVRLREERLKLGIKQKMAGLLGIAPKGAYQLLRRGESVFPIFMTLKIAELLAYFNRLFGRRKDERA